MTQISLPSHILKPHLKSGKGTHFAIPAELPRIGHFRGFRPGLMLALVSISMLQNWLFSCVKCLGLYTICEVGGSYCFLFFILDLDECKDKTHQCDVNANCTNIPGSYNCTCRPGYRGNGSICNGIISYPSLLPPEIDECKDGSHDCHINASCTNIPGSYNCTCRPGYTGNGRICKGKNLLVNFMMRLYRVGAYNPLW